MSKKLRTFAPQSYMLRRILHIATLVMAIYIALLGCGPNIQHYCSRECAEHHECCHHHHHTYHCGVEVGEACHCGVTHIAVPESNAPVHHALIPVVYSHVISVAAMVPEPRLTTSHISHHICHAPPITTGGRDIITRKSVLLI